MVSPWQNQQNRYDVSGNTLVSAQDALIVINLLGRHIGETILVTDAVSAVFADVNGDHIVSAMDALMVINALARDRAEGEIAAMAALTPATPVDASSDAERVQASDLVLGVLF